MSCTNDIEKMFGDFRSNDIVKAPVVVLQWTRCPMHLNIAMDHVQQGDSNFLTDSYYTCPCLMNQRSLHRLNFFFPLDAASRPIRLLSRSLL